VVDVLRGLLSEAGVPIDDSTDPICGLGLTSDDGLDFACDVSRQLGFHFPDDQNPFVDDAGHRARRVGEIVDLIVTMTSGIKEARRG
jgi:hypothetical protein